MKRDFLTAVLGSDGANALLKASLQRPEIEAALVPRTILAWIGIAATTEHRGSLPGLDNTYVSFKKSEHGYTGEVTVDDDVYEFKDASLYHLASAVAVSLGIDNQGIPAISSQSLAQLGKSIDILVKARVVTAALLDRKSLQKTDLPGMTSKPTQAAGPIEATPPTSVQAPQPRPAKHKPKLPKIKKLTVNIPGLPKLHLSEKSLHAPCRACGGRQMRGGGFVGCLCWRASATDVKLEKTESGYSLSFGSQWDVEAYQTFAESMRGK